jgi:hypothetical protein
MVRGIEPGPMRTEFRARVYHAENPLEQPEPSIAAAGIVKLLVSDISESDLLIRLNR